MQNQVRAVEGSLLGWDLGAGLRLAEALGYDLMAIAELIPEVETVACAKINERNREA